MTEVVQEALKNGIKNIELFVGTPSTREYFGNALKGKRVVVVAIGIEYMMGIV